MNMKNETNLIEGLHAEMDRVREIIKIYEKVPHNVCAFEIHVMKTSIKEAESAIAAGDTIKMLAYYNDLKEYISIAELTEICRMLDMDVDATFKIALHAEFLQMTMIELIDQLFSYGNN